jgi:hypothetical protein
VSEFLLTGFLEFLDYFFIYDVLAAKLGYGGPSASSIVAARGQIILSNSHFITHSPQPYLENVVQVLWPAFKGTVRPDWIYMRVVSLDRP